MAAGRQKKANMWHGRKNVEAYGRLPSPALPSGKKMYVQDSWLSASYSRGNSNYSIQANTLDNIYRAVLKTFLFFSPLHCSGHFVHNK